MITCKVSNHGAELQSLQKDGKEYPWNKQPYLKVGSDQTQAYGIWAPYKPGCPFVCLEPWCGITDLVGFSGELKDRYLNHSLKPGEKFAFTYWIEL